MAFAAIGALFSGAAVTATTVLAAVSQIGTIMSVVGAVTGNKSLMKIGGVMGLVGGVGGLINGATSSAASAGADALASTATDVAADVSAGAATEAANAAAGGVTEGLGAMTSPVSGATATGVELGTLGMEPAIVPAATTAQSVTAPIADAATQVTGVVTPADVAGNLGPAGVSAPAGVVSPADMTGNLAPQTSSSFFGSMSDFAAKNPKLIDTVTRAGLGMVSGAANSKYKEAELQLAQQRARFGNSVSNFAPGIVNRAAA